MPVDAIKLSPAKGMSEESPYFLLSAVYPMGNMKPLLSNS